MALTSAVTTTTAANTLVKRWHSELQLNANEEMVVAKNFWDADGEKIKSTLYVRKIATIAAAAPTVGSFDRASLTYTANTEAVTSVTPASAYGAVALERNVINQCLTDTELETAYRKQIARGLATYIDQSAADDVPNLSGQVGSGAVDISKSLILSAVKTLAVNAKDEFRAEKRNRYFIFHTNQLDKVLDIPQVTEAQIIGGSGSSPTVTGYVWDAYGLKLSDSGNVYQSGGITYNLLHLPRCLILAYNERPGMLAPQADGLSMLFIGYAEFGIAENYDNYGVGVLSTTS